MSKRTILAIIGALVLLIGWWSCHHHASSGQSGPAAGAGAGGRRGGAGGGPVPVVAGKVEQKDMPIYLDGLGTVQAFNTVTVHTTSRWRACAGQFFGRPGCENGRFAGRCRSKAVSSGARSGKSASRVGSSDAEEAGGPAREKRNSAQDYDTAVANAQKSKAAADAAQVNFDYCYIKSPIDGRTGVRLVDIGNVVHAADQNGIVVITQLHPISVVFTLPEQNLQSILNAGRRERRLQCNGVGSRQHEQRSTKARWRLSIMKSIRRPER